MINLPVKIIGLVCFCQFAKIQMLHMQEILQINNLSIFNYLKFFNDTIATKLYISQRKH